MANYTLKFDPLKKAIASLEDALAQPYGPYVRDATIQRFEYTFELAWKLLQRYLQTQTTYDTLSVKEMFRHAAKLKLIESSELWFTFLEARNLTARTYNEDTAKETYHAAKEFLPHAQQLLATLESVADVSH